MKVPNRSAVPAVRWYGWHRTLGLLAGIPALFMVTAGVLLVFEEQTEAVIQPPPIEAPSQSLKGPIQIGFANAAKQALGVFPDASLTAVYLPNAEELSYRVRLLRPGEDRRAYGTTTVFISAIDGRLLAKHDALSATPSRRFFDGLFAFHTGELGGLVGRLASLMIGVWLTTMTILGFLLWLRRRRKKPLN